MLLLPVSLHGQAAGPSTPPQLVIAANPSLVEGPQWWERDQTEREFEIYVRVGTATNVDVSTLGLGDVGLSAGDCTDRKGARVSVLRLQSLTTNPSRICISFPRNAFPDGAQSAKGKIIVASPSVMVEAAVSLGATTMPVWLTALLWGVGVAIPAFASAFLTFYVYQKQKKWDDERNRQKIAAEGQRKNASKAVDEFFTVYLPYTNKQKDEEFSEMLRPQIESLNLEGLPEGQEKTLRSAIDAKQRDGILNALKEVYPKYEAQIEAARRKSGARKTQ